MGMSDQLTLPLGQAGYKAYKWVVAWHPRSWRRLAFAAVRQMLDSAAATG